MNKASYVTTSKYNICFSGGGGSPNLCRYTYVFVCIKLILKYRPYSLIMKIDVLWENEHYKIILWHTCVVKTYPYIDPHSAPPPSISIYNICHIPSRRVSVT